MMTEDEKVRVRLILPSELDLSCRPDPDVTRHVTRQARIKKEGEGVLKDRALISALANRTGIYIDLEVRLRGHPEP